MDIAELQAWAYFILTAFVTFILYAYIIHLYRSEHKGEKDYEKYGNIALDDDISSTPIEKKGEEESSKESNKDS